MRSAVATRPLLLMLALTVLFGQEVTEQASVSGRILNAASNVPIEGAEVYLFQSSAANEADKVRTDANGNFRITQLQPGTYNLGVDKTGFLGRRPGLLSNLGETPRLEIRAGSKIDALNIRLRPAASISGTVLGQDGEPMSGVLVTAISRTLADPKNGWGPSARTRTKSNGSYRFSSLEPDAYWIVVFPPLPKSPTGYPRTIYPNSETLHGAQPVIVSSAEEKMHIDFNLSRVQFFEISGTYKTGHAEYHGLPTKARLRGETVLDDLGFDEVYHTDLGSDGTFRFKAIRPGDYRIDILDFHRAAEYISADIRLGAESVRELNIEPRPLCTIQGKALFDGRGSLTTKLKLIFEPREVWHEPSTHSVDVDPNGFFRIDKIRPGSYFIDLTDANSEYYAKSIRFAGVDPRHAPVSVSCGNDSVDLLLSRSMVRVSGRVSNGAATGSTTGKKGAVIFRPTRGFNSRAHSLVVAHINSSGVFPRELIAPGTYLAYAFEEIDFGLARDASLLDRLRRRAVAFTVAPDEVREIELSLITAADLESERKQP